MKDAKLLDEGGVMISNTQITTRTSTTTELFDHASWRDIALIGVDRS